MLESEAVLAVSPKLSDEKQRILNKFQSRIESVLRGRNSKYVLMNAPNNKLQDILKAITRNEKPNSFAFG